MKHWSIKLAAALFVAAFVAAPHADAQVTKSGSNYTFRMKFTKGQTTRYNVVTNMTMGGAGSAGGNNAPAMKMEMPMTMLVENVQKDVADLKMTVGPPTMNGQAMGQSQPQTQTMKMDSRGRVVGGGQSMGGVMATLPDKPIAVGGTWTAQMPMQGMGNMNATYKFLGLKNEGGRQVAEIEVTVSSKGQMNASGSGRMFILASDGSLLRSSLNLNASMPTGQGQGQGAGGQMRMQVTIARR
jgi:hypothetical protein